MWADCVQNPESTALVFMFLFFENFSLIHDHESFFFSESYLIIDIVTQARQSLEQLETQIMGAGSFNCFYNKWSKKVVPTDLKLEDVSTSIGNKLP